MNRSTLIEQIFQKETYLCIGLDPDLAQMPHHLRQDPQNIFDFCRQIIDATAEFCVAYKLNTAFFEQYGAQGWLMMHQIMTYIAPTHFVIADAKRGDIGNTSAAYARSFFEALPAHAVTLAPYMGSESVLPFLAYKNKWAIVLALTSNASAADFQFIATYTHAAPHGQPLYQAVLRTAQTWGTPHNLMFVVGATQAAALVEIRTIVPQHFLLVPGVGAQGGSLHEVSKNALTPDCGLLINASRSVLYASTGTDFSLAARTEAQKIQAEMADYLNIFCKK
jgi:orotidine-5'-phosphate decarboxylase